MAYGGYPDTSFDRSRLKKVGRPTRGMSRASYDLFLVVIAPSKAWRLLRGESFRANCRNRSFIPLQSGANMNEWMRENCTSGTAPVAPGNRRPYG